MWCGGLPCARCSFVLSRAIPVCNQHGPRRAPDVRRLTGHPAWRACTIWVFRPPVSVHFDENLLSPAEITIENMDHGLREKTMFGC